MNPIINGGELMFSRYGTRRVQFRSYIVIIDQEIKGRDYDNDQRFFL
jgi:hypothetical protein